MKRILILIIAMILMIPAGLAEGEIGELSFLNMDEISAELMEQTLSDDDVMKLDHTDLETLKKKISTFGDLLAYVKMKSQTLGFVNMTTSNPSGQLTFGAKFAFEWLGSWFSPNQMASIGQYALEDNYSGIEVLVCGIKEGNQQWMRCSLCIPTENGYYLLNPEMFIDSIQNQLEMTSAFPRPMLVSDPSGVVKFFDDPSHGEKVIQVFLLQSSDRMVLNLQDNMYVPTSDENIILVYENKMAIYPDASEKLHFKEYGFPKQIKTDSDIGLETALALSEQTLEEAAAQIHTLPDLMNYLFYSRYATEDGDQQLAVRDGIWHYNYGPHKVFGRGKGNCGGTSGLVAYLLQGDYDEIGMINIKFADSNGHVINYIRDGKAYYVFDIVQWVGSGYMSWGLSFQSGKDLKKTALEYGKMHNTRMMVAYTHAAGGDAPTLWDGTDNCRFPEGYCETVEVLQDTPKEGFVYTMFEADPKAMQGIDMIRDVW